MLFDVTESGESCMITFQTARGQEVQCFLMSTEGRVDTNVIETQAGVSVSQCKYQCC